jgi:hypothetical protein
MISNIGAKSSEIIGMLQAGKIYPGCDRSQGIGLVEKAIQNIILKFIVIA